MTNCIIHYLTSINFTACKFSTLYVVLEDLAYVDFKVSNLQYKVWCWTELNCGVEIIAIIKLWNLVSIFELWPNHKLVYVRVWSDKMLVNKQLKFYKQQGQIRSRCLFKMESEILWTCKPDQNLNQAPINLLPEF